ncbi:hypothetical protein CgunFtcFv8_000922 [Champsocephalus gunnari]|uniref:Uncharacterized protein n=1 Tax=Champsocephalus gunnari TaxID=52237 RepID=A0AAN8DN76_CHAGU|nr:hypothetical protein CgunFtcFv8_000922 [Champsocephalus gunnari]
MSHSLTHGQTWFEATKQLLHGAATDLSLPQSDLRDAESLLLQHSQAECFQEEIECLKAGQPVKLGSKLSMLSLEIDPAMGLIRVGGRFRHLETSCDMEIHPIVLDPSHVVTKLLIKDMDERLLHPGPDRVFAETRCQYWVNIRFPNTYRRRRL